MTLCSQKEAADSLSVGRIDSGSRGPAVRMILSRATGRNERRVGWPAPLDGSEERYGVGGKRRDFNAWERSWLP
jgi:hypothetical protein